MAISGRKTSQAFKRFVSYTVYFFTGLTGCFLALVLVLNFLNPVFSEESDQQQQEEQLTFKKVFRDIFKNLKLIAKDNLSGSPDAGDKAEPSEALKGPQEVEIPKEDLKASEKEAAPEEFKGEIPGDAIQPSSDTPDESSAPGGQAVSSSEGEVSEPPVQEPSESHVPGETQDTALSDVALEIKSYMAPFVYESVKKKDPFEDPTVEKVQKKGEKGVIVIPKTPPEAYELKEIQLKGIIWDTKNPKALFKLPGNAGYYTLIKGDKVGKKGVIFDIKEDEVVIVETSYVGAGEQRKMERIIKIKKMNRIGIS